MCFGNTRSSRTKSGSRSVCITFCVRIVLVYHDTNGVLLPTLEMLSNCGLLCSTQSRLTSNIMMLILYCGRQTLEDAQRSTFLAVVKANHAVFACLS